MVPMYKKEEMAEHEARIIFKYFMGQPPPKTVKAKPLKTAKAEPLSDAQKSILGHADKMQSCDSTEVSKEYEYGKPFLPFHVMLELPWPMRLL